MFISYLSLQRLSDFYDCEFPNRGLFLQTGNNARSTWDTFLSAHFMLIFKERIVLHCREAYEIHWQKWYCNYA